MNEVINGLLEFMKILINAFTENWYIIAIVFLVFVIVGLLKRK